MFSLFQCFYLGIYLNVHLLRGNNVLITLSLKGFVLTYINCKSIYKYILLLLFFFVFIFNLDYKYIICLLRFNYYLLFYLLIFGFYGLGVSVHWVIPDCSKIQNKPQLLLPFSFVYLNQLIISLIYYNLKNELLLKKTKDMDVVILWGRWRNMELWMGLE